MGEVARPRRGEPPRSVARCLCSPAAWRPSIRSSFARRAAALASASDATVSSRQLLLQLRSGERAPPRETRDSAACCDGPASGSSVSTPIVILDSDSDGESIAYISLEPRMSREDTSGEAMLRFSDSPPCRIARLGLCSGKLSRASSPLSA